MSLSTTLSSARVAANRLLEFRDQDTTTRHTEKRDRFEFSDALDVFDELTSRGVGGALETLSDSLGLPDVIGDIAGLAGDLMMMNVPGILENSADLGADIARMCGNEKLEGFCDAASDKMTGFNKVAGKITFTAVTTVASGGTATVGSSAMSVADFTKGLQMVRSGLSCADNLQNGKPWDAAGDALASLTAFNAIGGSLGVDAETLELTGKIADAGTKYLPAAAAIADGGIDASDLQHIPVGALAEDLGVDLGDNEELVEALLKFSGKAAAGEDPATILRSMALDLISFGSGLAGTDELEERIEDVVLFQADLWVASIEDEQVASGLAETLELLSNHRQDIDLTALSLSLLRA